jgi:hypothetical protein
MDLEQLMGRYFRLKQELATAYREQPWRGGHVDRLTDELATTGRDLAALQPRDEQCSDTVPDFAR